MFDIGFSEILVIFVLALIVLGPEKLPRVVREVGRWVGRARAMARQFQEQLEDEVDTDRSRTIRPRPVRPVGGVPSSDALPLTPEDTAVGEPPYEAPPPGGDEPAPQGTAASAERSTEPAATGTHERGT